MGTYSTVAGFVDAIDDMGYRIAAPNKRATIDAAETFGEIIDAAADKSGATSFGGRKRPPYRIKMRGSEAFIRPGNVGANVALNSGTRPHIIGAKGLGTRRKFQTKAAGIGAVTAFGGSAVGMIGTRRSKGKRALSWSGVEHPTPFAFVSGTSGFGFVGASKDKAMEAAAEVWLAAKRRELLKGGR